MPVSVGGFLFAPVDTEHIPFWRKAFITVGAVRDFKSLLTALSEKMGLNKPLNLQYINLADLW